VAEAKLLALGNSSSSRRPQLGIEPGTLRLPGSLLLPPSILKLVWA